MDAYYYAFLFILLIDFPYNLLGLLFIPVGIYLVINPWYSFKNHNTPEDFSESTALVKDGLYKYSRNPMYLGGIFILIGLAITTCNLCALIAPFLFFIIMNYMFIPFEEEKMNNTFGDEYKIYKNKVRRWI
ncbi:methyltransferase family protein [Bacteroidota bacterium]